MRVIQETVSGNFVFMSPDGTPIPMARHEAEFVIDTYGYSETLPDQRDRYARTFLPPRQE